MVQWLAKTHNGFIVILSGDAKYILARDSRVFMPSHRNLTLANIKNVQSFSLSWLYLYPSVECKGL